MGLASAIRLSFPDDDIGLLTIDDPDRSVNVLSRELLQQLRQRLVEVAERNELAGLIIASGKDRSFLAGADLNELAASNHRSLHEKSERIREVQQLFQRFSELPGVTVAAIGGACLGGGTELAVWCDRRIVTDSPETELSFPEVHLGLFPGWGGTARTPRIVGLPHAVEWITQGRSIDAMEATAVGLASDRVPSDRLISSAIDLIRQEQRTGQYLRDRQRWSGPVQILEAERAFLWETERAKLRQTSPQNPAPRAALDLLESTAALDLEAACRRESEAVARLVGTPINQALLHLFFLRKHNRKKTGAGWTKMEPQSIRSVAVIGAGIMGAGIAAASMGQEIPVTMADANAEALSQGIEQALQQVCVNRSTRQQDPAKITRFAPLLRGAVSDADLSGCDVAIEAIVENADVKRQVYSRIEPLLQRHAILASNTSTIRITELAKSLQFPDRFCGMHFFNPVRKMQLVEIIRGQQTSDQTIATAVAFAKRLGKLAVVVQDSPGFLVNRLLGPYLNEAIALVAEGTPLMAIEQTAMAFGMPIGPLQLYDMVGLDTAFYAGRIMWEAFPERIKPSPILPALIKAGRLGHKSGAGFFRYPDRRQQPQDDPDVQRIIRTYIEPRPNPPDPSEIEDRLILPMLLDATRVLQEQIVDDVRDVDLGLIYGIGFPATKGGLLFWVDRVGMPKIMTSLRSLEHLGPRFTPTPLLQQMADGHQKFYSPEKLAS